MRNFTKILCLLAALAPACTDIDDPVGEVEAESRTTTVSQLPREIVLAHLDSNSGTNQVQWTGKRLFVTRANFENAPVMHYYFDAAIISVVVGNFALPTEPQATRDQVCAWLWNNKLECIAPDASGTSLRRWFSQTYPLLSGEQPIVGDFTGDGADDILAFNSANGTLRMLARASAGGSFLPRAFSLGNLATNTDLHGKQLYAGEFGQTVGRTDLLVVDRVARNVAAFASADDGANTTFWWGWTTGANTLVANEQITVANLEGGSRDGLMLRDPATGRLRAMRAAYGNGYLDPIPSSVLSVGQLPVTTQSGTLVAAKLTSSSSQRDDFLFFNHSANFTTEIDAAGGTPLTYAHQWTRATPLQASFPERAENMALVFCKTADQDREPSISQLRQYISQPNNGSIRDFLHEVTFGSIDIQDPDVYGWVRSSYRGADSCSHGDVPGCINTGMWLDDCMAKAGITSAQYNGRVLVVFNEEHVSFQGPVGYGATCDYATVLSGKLSGVTHELLHAFGLDHAHDDSGNSCGGNYCDTSDIMGNFYPSQITTPYGTVIGPGLNAAHLDMLGVFPSARTVTLDPATAPASTTITLAPVERPEAAGTLLVKVKTGTATYYTIALRNPVGYDTYVGTGVQIHRVDPPSKVSVLQVSPQKLLQPTDVATAGSFVVRINGYDNVRRTVSITVTH